MEFKKTWCVNITSDTSQTKQKGQLYLEATLVTSGVFCNPYRIFHNPQYGLPTRVATRLRQYSFGKRPIQGSFSLSQPVEIVSKKPRVVKNQIKQKK